MFYRWFRGHTDIHAGLRFKDHIGLRGAGNLCFQQRWSEFFLVPYTVPVFTANCPLEHPEMGDVDGFGRVLCSRP